MKRNILLLMLILMITSVFFSCNESIKEEAEVREILNHYRKNDYLGYLVLIPLDAQCEPCVDNVLDTTKSWTSDSVLFIISGKNYHKMESQLAANHYDLIKDSSSMALRFKLISIYPRVLKVKEQSIEEITF